MAADPWTSHRRRRASGAAVAWSLADTRMRIVCLEQGDGVKADQYPGMRDEWELAQIADWGPSLNVPPPARGLSSEGQRFAVPSTARIPRAAFYANRN